MSSLFQGASTPITMYDPANYMEPKAGPTNLLHAVFESVEVVKSVIDTII